MATPTHVLEAIAKDDKLMLAYERRILRSAVSHKASIRRALTEALSDLMTDSKGRVHDNNINRAILDFSLSQIDDILGAGYDDLIKEIQETFDRRLKTMNRMPNGMKVPDAVLSEAFMFPVTENALRESISKIAQGREYVILELENRIRDLRNTELGSGRVQRRELVRTLSQKAGIQPQYASTIARTQLASVDRRLKIEQGLQAEIDLYKYVGPNDSLTRPFCSTHVGEVKTLEQWRALDNGQINPPNIYGGGYNCRHQLILWKQEWN